MGYEWLGEGYHDNSDRCFEQGIKDYEGDVIEARFHESWDWLMPVVEKITPLAKQLGQQAWFDISSNLVEVNIEVAYKRIVEFIKWYNQQSK